MLLIRFSRGIFLSTLSLRRATQAQGFKIPTHSISIHALLAESDTPWLAWLAPGAYFYPRSPCGERPCTLTITICIVLFLSTLSLRRATVAPLLATGSPRYFYPRSPCGERQSPPSVTPATSRNFYPRSPCGERRKSHKLAGQKLVFLSTLSLRRATRLPTALRTPHHKFLSTLSLRRATTNHDRGASNHQISIHALLAESDGLAVKTGFHDIANFYPRSPCGERLHHK